MSFSIFIDWQEELNNCGKWENHGRRIVEENCHHKTQDNDRDSNARETNVRYSGYCDECDISEDSCQPMMNYAYPLETTPDDDKILEAVKQTNCTVMGNTQTGEYFLALCGGGMDLSQDIALAYVILERWIPTDLILQVNKQRAFSISEKNYRTLKKAIIEQLKIDSEKFLECKKEWRKRK